MSWNLHQLPRLEMETRLKQWLNLWDELAGPLKKFSATGFSASSITASSMAHQVLLKREDLMAVSKIRQQMMSDIIHVNNDQVAMLGLSLFKKKVIEHCFPSSTEITAIRLAVFTIDYKDRFHGTRLVLAKCYLLQTKDGAWLPQMVSVVNLSPDARRNLRVFFFSIFSLDGWYIEPDVLEGKGFTEDEG